MRSSKSLTDPNGPVDWLQSLDLLPGELSSHLIRLNSDQINRAIAEALRRIVEVFDVDCGTLFERADAVEELRQVHTWHREGIPPPDPAGVKAFPWVGQQLLQGQSVLLNRIPDDLAANAGKDRDSASARNIKSMVVLTVTVAGGSLFVMAIASMREYRTWTPSIVERLRLITEILATAVHRKRQDQSLTQARAEVFHLRPPDLAGHERAAATSRSPDFDEIIGESPVLRASLDRVMEVAPTDSTVLLLGETGTGKELFARALHEHSPRRTRPLVRVNCAALPASLIETELFGHEKGAFTGAVALRQGRFERADRGTIFLDEIGDLPLEVQAKLLRVLQEGEFERLGSSQTRKVDVRLITATHRDLDKAVADGRFRADLYYRLNVYPIVVPPLRNRREDIPALVWFLVHRRQRALGRRITTIAADTMEMLQQYDWPGNVRELENVIERALIRSSTETLVLDEGIGARHRPAGVEGAASLEFVERRHIEEVLRTVNWRVNGQGNAADRLGLHPNTLRFRMKKLGITRPPRPS